MTSISQRMRDTCAPDWDAVCAHPFAAAIGRGDLDLQSFRRYLVQGYVVLGEYARVLALSSARSPDLETQTWFARLMHATLETEMDLHRRVCREWGLAPSDLDRTPALPTTLGLMSFLTRTAAVADLAETSCALLAHQWTHADLGRRLLDDGPPDHEPRYAAWVRSYAQPGYAELTGWLRGFVDRAGEHADDATYLRWRRTFRTMLRLERAFLDMALVGEDWPG